MIYFFFCGLRWTERFELEGGKVMENNISTEVLKKLKPQDLPSVQNLPIFLAPRNFLIPFEASALLSDTSKSR